MDNENNRVPRSLDTGLDFKLDSMSVIDRQNLVTYYLMMVYNTFYNIGDLTAKYLIDRVYWPRIRRKAVRTHFFLRIPNFISSNTTGPTIWDCNMYGESSILNFKLSLTPTSCCVDYKLDNETVPINDELIGTYDDQVDARRAARREEARRNYIILEDGESTSSSDCFDDGTDFATPLEDPPNKRYHVKTESKTEFTRTAKGVVCESKISFAFHIKTYPNIRVGDEQCDLTIKTISNIIVDNDRTILTSKTSVDERLINYYERTTVTKKHIETPTVCLVQTMDPLDAFALCEGIVTNYTVTINIIIIATILHFGST